MSLHPAGLTATTRPTRSPALRLLIAVLLAVGQLAILAPAASAAAGDYDDDGVPNVTDNCPFVSNVGQADGDADGVGDDCDPSPADPDHDGDGVNDGVDNCILVSNPSQLDADTDGVGNACDAAPADADADADGLNDGEELNIHGTDPAVTDTDGGGINDGDEVTHSFDPNNATDDTVDTDGDGLNNDIEVNTHGTDPNDVDTDGGGVEDGDEVTFGLDPLNPADDTAELTEDHLTGLGMGESTVISGRTLPGGIVYRNLETLDLMMGSGADDLTIFSTHEGATNITTGDGNDIVVVREAAGHTTVDTGRGKKGLTCYLKIGITHGKYRVLTRTAVAGAGYWGSFAGRFPGDQGQSWRRPRPARAPGC